MNYLEIIATILSIIGNLYIIKKKWIGHLLWFIGNIFWGILAIKYKLYFMAGLQFIFYNVLCVIGIYKWRKKDAIK